ncbi:hypothetical protein [Streptomyces boninensis]|uniref:hypothetical protein n=1 Tax=Streptomyces boninensis TaxID=2039455 RepID=UPI003B216EC4
MASRVGIRKWWLTAAWVVATGVVVGTVATWVGDDRLWTWEWASHCLRWTAQWALTWALLAWLDRRRTAREAARAAERRREIEEGWSRTPLPPD